MKSLGRHLLVELYDCDPGRIADVHTVEEIMLESARRSGAEIIKPVFHRFEPWGVSGVVVIAESHFSIHTWPEYAYCAVDIFTCGDDIDNNTALKYIHAEFRSKSLSIVEMKRGVLNIPEDQLTHKLVKNA
jgi:S-adenosylmethionine decarboxylase